MLTFLSIEEYNLMYESAKLIHGNKEKAKTFEANILSRKRQVMRHWDHHHQSSLISGRQIFWKAAAVFFFLCTSYLLFAVFSKSTLPYSQHITLRDSVNAAAPVVSAKQIIHDTIYILKEHTTSKHQKNIANKKRKLLPAYLTHNQPILPATIFSVSSDIHILPLNEINNISNVSKGNSMKADSLQRNFRFVSL